jgi:hypothetical protein
MTQKAAAVISVILSKKAVSFFHVVHQAAVLIS